MFREKFTENLLLFYCVCISNYNFTFLILLGTILHHSILHLWSNIFGKSTELRKAIVQKLKKINEVQGEHFLFTKQALGSKSKVLIQFLSVLFTQTFSTYKWEECLLKYAGLQFISKKWKYFSELFNNFAVTNENWYFSLEE